MFANANNSPSTVCFRRRAFAKQELRASPNHRDAMADELLQHLLEVQLAGLPSTSAKKMIEKDSCSGENWYS